MEKIPYEVELFAGTLRQMGFTEAADQLLAAWKSMPELPPVPAIPEELKIMFDEVKAKSIAVANDIPEINSYLISKGILGALPLVNMSAPWDAMYLHPYRQARFQRATRYAMAGYDFGEEPFIKQNWQYSMRPNLPDIDTLAFMHARRSISTEMYTNYMGRHGITDEAAILISDANKTFPDLNTLLVLKRRNAINDATFRRWLDYNRYADGVADPLTVLVEQIPEPYRIGEMYAKDVVGLGDAYSGMEKHGIAKIWADRWLSAQFTYPTSVELMQMINRGFIDEEAAMFYLRRSGYNPLAAKQLLQLKEVIPPLGDLIHMAVREAFGDHTSEVQYPEYESWAKKMGLSPYFAGAYWFAHWDRIPLAQMYENVWRGYWDKERFMRMLKIKDIHEEDREDIWNVMYRPPSIREQGYGFDMGIYEREDLVKYRKMGGLSPGDAEKSADATIEYRTAAERDAVIREYMYLYAKDRVSMSDFGKVLTRLKINPKAALLWVERANLYKIRMQQPEVLTDYRIVTSSEALTAFKKGMRDEAWLRKALQELDWTHERIELSVQRAKLEMEEDKQKEEKQQQEEKKQAERTLTLAQAQQLFTIGVWDKFKATSYLAAQGYSETVIKLIFELWSYKEETIPEVKAFTTSVAAGMYELSIYDEDDLYGAYREMDYDEYHAAMMVLYTLVSIEYPKQRTLYEKGAITIEELIRNLSNLGLSPEAADRLGYETRRDLQIERLSHEKDMTKAEIIKGVKMGVFDVIDGVHLLMDLGYDENEAYYILAINKVVAAGDPEGYYDMKRVTEAYKKARGLKSMEISDELIQLEKEIKTVKAELDRERKIGANEEKIAELAKRLGTLNDRLKALLTGKTVK